MGGNVAVKSGVNAAEPSIERQTMNALETLDDRFANIAEQVPAFGGLFYDQMGQLTMYVMESEPNVQEAMNSVMAALGHLDKRITSVNAIRVLPAQYNFSQLKRWHDHLFAPVFSVQGVVLTDVDEASNRVRIGVESLEAIAQVEERLAELGIPREAVLIEQTEPIRHMATLRDRIRPLQAGLQINFSGYLCTLGFNATRAGVPGFVTCSHCTDRQGGVESTTYYQPSTSSSNLIGTEIADPTYFRGGVCPRGSKCRYSDSAFASLASGVTSTYAIEQTTGLGSITIAGSYSITGEVAAPLAGETLNKVGRTTGWSQGNVTATCVNTGVSGSNIVQLCQDFVAATVAGGDSGSPVFKITGSSTAQLYGILWGGSSSQFVFSRMANVERSGELGSLTTN
jgi:hypothetical protein